MLVLAMDEALACDYAQALEHTIGPCLWLNPRLASKSPDLGSALTATQANQALGSNRCGVIYNAHEEFNATAFCALSGTIEAGGVLVLLVPELDQWVHHGDQQLLAYEQTPDHSYSFFKRWWINLWPSHDAIYVYHGLGLNTELKPLLTRPEKMPLATQPALQPSPQQSQIIHQLIQAYNSQEPAVYCLNAKRGRGKSSCLGWVVAALSNTDRTNTLQYGPVLVTAPSKRAFASMQFTAGADPINFWAVDALLAHKPQAGMLIVDEAAALPLSQLALLAQTYELLVLCSTQDGYEGSGQGYRLKLPRLLADLGRPVKQLSLHQPMRWSENDPLEAMVLQSFLCDQQICQQTGQQKDQQLLHKNTDKADLQGLQHQCLSNATLAGNSHLLHQVYGLLMLAHYQTTPQDLRQLLDHGTAQVHVWLLGKQIVGVAWISVEGGFDVDLAGQVELGKRRVQGHLLAQILAQQAGFAQAAQLCSWRIQRLAVLPKLQGLGLGSRMLVQLQQLAAEQQLDYLGASFAAAPELLNFWYSNAYQAVWFGVKADAATGLNSVQVMLPLSKAAVELADALHSHLQGYLAFAKDTWFAQISTPVWAQLTNSDLKANNGLDKQQQRRLLQLLGKDSGAFYGSLYLLHEVLSKAQERAQIINPGQLSKKAHQRQVRHLALNYLNA
jgi:tRNA(Met) cytidine acetyltransferase